MNEFSVLIAIDWQQLLLFIAKKSSLIWGSEPGHALTPGICSEPGICSDPGMTPGIKTKFWPQR
jgi:hypothetical protein